MADPIVTDPTSGTPSFFSWVNDLWEWVTAYWEAFQAYLKDLPVLILKDFLSAVASVIESIPTPEFLSEASLGSLLSALPPAVLFFVDQSGIDQGMVILGAAFAFRMLRKFITLFQW